eukprot:TRINITY_DN15283_c0_g1_i1.p1 TRINITY_DN15283_c0_g1~~TRINITY_DN15283_c0_g1_i1.p1  ORF type:complete len:605 (-),score=78.07 TRINITY_DN15283_c0_g1_i1:300-2114(-)
MTDRTSQSSSMRTPTRSKKSLVEHSLTQLSRPTRLQSQSKLPSSQVGFSTDEGDSRCLSMLKKIVTSYIYDLFMSVVIVTNTIVVVIETDRSVDPDVQPAAWLDAIGIVFMAVYTLDVGSRIYIQTYKFVTYFWNLFDALMVASDVVMLFMPMASSLAALRLLRVLRMARIVRLLKLFKELHIMLYGLVSAMKAILWSVLMLGLVLTFQSVVMVQLLHPVALRVEKADGFGDCTLCKDAFASVMQCNLTIMMTVVAGDSWGQLARPLIKESPIVAGSLLITCLLTISLGLLNLILTVIVNAAQKAHDDDIERRFLERQQLFDAAKTELIDMCCKLDVDGTGDLTLAEIKAGFEDKEFAKLMHLLDMQKTDVELVFSILDEDRSGTVTYREFVEQVHKMKTQDTHTMLVFIKGYLNQVRLKLNDQLKFMKNEIHANIEELFDALVPNSTKTKAERHHILENTSTTSSIKTSLLQHPHSAHCGGEARELRSDLDSIPQDMMNLLGELNRTLQYDLKQLKEQLNVDVESMEQIKERLDANMKRMLTHASETKQQDAEHITEISGSQKHDTKHSGIGGSADVWYPAPMNELTVNRSTLLSGRDSNVKI